MQDSLSDDALMPLKSYKYQSVDKSFISRYILKHYVRSHYDSMEPFVLGADNHARPVECLC